MKNTTLFITLFLLFPFISYTQQTIYVQANAAGSGTGTSWVNAFTDLQTALATAVSGDEIWVAQGIYKPDAGTDRTATFLLKSGVKIYGGFSGNETGLEQRNWNSYPTVLSGNIGSSSLRTDNSYHIVTGYSLDSTTTLDGFTIADGYSPDDYGAGIQLSCGSPLVINCFFTRNYAYSGGAASIGSTGVDGCLLPRLKNCRFERNSAYLFGGALYSSCSTTAQDTFLLDHCSFAHNRAPNIDSQGGAIYFEASTHSSNIRLLGCIFDRDSCLTGGAVSINPSELVYYEFDSCFFYKNHATSASGIHYLDDFNGPGQKIICALKHCRFEENIAWTDTGAAYYFEVTDSADVEIRIKNCDFVNNKSISQTSVYTKAQGNSKVKISAENSTFIGDRYGIACFLGNADVYNKSEMYLTSCLFAHNEKGITSTTPTERNYATTEVRGCTFFDNGKYIFVKNHFPGHAFHYLFQADTFYNKMLIENCIIWEKGSNGDNMFYNVDPTLAPLYNPSGWGFTIRNSSISTQQFQVGLIDIQGVFDSVIYAQYPQFVDTLSDDFRLLPCSPMVNKGRNEGVAGLLDLSGLPRIAGGTVDMGAYEQQDSCIVNTAPYIEEILPLSISPNPSSDGWCTLSGISSGILNVYDLSGRVLHRQNIRQDASVLPLDLSRLSSGVYLITVDTEQGRYVGKWARE